MIGPGQRSAILHRAVQIFDERREEIIGWIIRESGSTRIKAQIEWGAARSITLSQPLFRRGCTGAFCRPTSRARKIAFTESRWVWWG
jgi:hypothetical protein